MHVLDLYVNYLTGIIAKELGSLTGIPIKYLYDNKLAGSFPSALCLLTHMQSLDASSSLLSGALPTQVGNLAGWQDFLYVYLVDRQVIVNLS